MSDAPAQTANELGQVMPAGAVPGRNGGYLKPVRDRAAAQEMAALRWDAVSRVGRLGVADAGKQITGIDTHGSLPVIRYLVEQHTLNAADPSAPGSVQSFREIMRIAYPSPERTNSGNSSDIPPGGAQLNLDAGALDRLIQALKER